MATIDLTLDQILHAVKHLPPAQRRRVAQALRAKEETPQALDLFRRLRPRYRLATDRRRRMSALLHESKDRRLTPSEKTELDELVAESELKTLELAQDVAERMRRATKKRDRDGD